MCPRGDDPLTLNQHDFVAVVRDGRAISLRLVDAMIVLSVWLGGACAFSVPNGLKQRS
jgi:hypothetical protein